MFSCLRYSMRAVTTTQIQWARLSREVAFATTFLWLDGSRIITKGPDLTRALIHPGKLPLPAGHQNVLNLGHHIWCAPASVSSRESNADAIQRSSANIRLRAASLGWRGRTF